MPTVRPGTNILVQAPSLSATRTDRCHDLLSPRVQSALDVLRISYSGDPQELVDGYYGSVDEMPARVGIVVVDGPTEFEEVTDPTDSDTVAATSANPNDITGLGMRLNNYLNDVDPDHQLVVCLDSLTEMLQFVGVRPAFKFLHVFTGQLRDADAIGHFHIDPDAHDTKTISQLKPTFDEQVTVD